jgi:hypothetical protein
VEVFRFDDTRKERIFLCGYVLDSVSDKTFVDKVKISDSKATIVL